MRNRRLHDSLRAFALDAAHVLSAEIEGGAEVQFELYEGVLQAAIAAPLPGLVMERDRVEIGDGLVLVRGDLSGAPPEAVWPAGAVEIERGRAQPHVVALIENELAADSSLPLPEARWRL